LDQACAGDADLRREIERLLTAHPLLKQFLEQPAGPPAGGTGPFTPSAAPAPALAVGSVVAGRYKLRERLGEGGMGVVYVADQTHPVQRRVALKVVKAGLDSAAALTRFEQERQALALMDHPHIAKILDAGTTDAGRPFFVMELVKGIPITKYCDQEKLSPRERLELFVPVCQAVQHAHQKGVIHRDLKPSNILVALYDGRPVPKVIDFGVAKTLGPRLSEHSVYTEAGTMVGTLEYMAPEQAELNNLDIDTRADVYALGVVLYELLTGSVPFPRKQLQAAGLAEMLRVIKEVEPPRPSTRLSSSGDLPSLAAVRKLEPRRLTKLVRGDLDWIAMKCLEKERARRYETANGLAMDLQRYLADEPVLAGPPSFGYRLRKFVQRNRPQAIAAVVVLLALLGGVAGTTWGMIEAKRQERIAQGALEAQTRLRVAAEEAAAAEAAAKQEAKRQLSQLGVVVFVLNHAFGDFDIDEPAQPDEPANEPTLDRLGRRLNRALGSLSDESVGEGLVAARLFTGFAGAVRFAGGYEAGCLRMYELARPILTKELGPDDPETLACMFNWAEALDASGQSREAVATASDLLARQRRLHPAGDVRTAKTLFVLGSALLKTEEYADAEPALRECLAIRAKKRPDTWELAGTRSLLGAVLVGQKKYAEAEPLLREGYAGLKRREATMPAGNKVRLSDAVERLVQFYEATDKPDEAAKWRKELEARDAPPPQ
jgi:tRNA A-37 threonylcarbamoyl transferase component Bud32